MLYSKKWKAGMLLLLLSLTVLIFSGCGLFGPDKESESIDPPQNTQDVNNTEVVNTTGDNGLSITTVGGEVVYTDRVVFLLDPNGYVVPMTLNIPTTNQAFAKQVMAYMVKGGPVESLLPTGFTAPLPEGTAFEISIQNGLAIIDFSKEFTDYEAKDETKILEAVTWAMTEFPTVQKVQIWIDGKAVDTMPVAGAPIDQPLTRADGINVEIAKNANPGDTSAVTLYFEGETPTADFRYFVPVTRLVPRTTDLAEATVKELIKGPSPDSGLVTSLLPSTQVRKTALENGIAIADFDEALLGFDITGKASAKGLESIVLSLTATTGAEKVQIMVNGKAEVMTESLDFTQPVTSPKQINVLEF